ncbi:hypothetical protein F4604DRAFT_1882717 [Suillus subluteus]|nr:hypothetical protein F4604DRAFT_1882717 [Suillus subluteus]
MDFDAILPPPGEEGFATSHCSEEHALYSELEQMAHAHNKPADTRDWSLRITSQVAAWAAQYEALTDALLAYLDNPIEQLQINDSDDMFEMEVVDIFGELCTWPLLLTNSCCALGHSIHQFKHKSIFTNVTLLHYSCIGSLPVKPNMAITVQMLTKLCHMQNICYWRYLADQLHAAYDVYLKLQGTPDWWMHNSCPACQYTLEQEPPLLYSIICACDGNNSAKLVDPAVCSGVECSDPRSGTSPIWLSKTYVDQFADEVGNARQNTHPHAPSAHTWDLDDPWIEEPDLADSLEPASICVDQWCNTAPESRKKMFAIFKKSGIFITVCRHSFLLTICDMVWSGEL